MITCLSDPISEMALRISKIRIRIIPSTGKSVSCTMKDIVYLLPVLNVETDPEHSRT